MMDSVDLLAREKEFKKLNQQLEKKSESLMKQIENAMQKHDIFSEFSGSLATPSPTIYTRHYCETPKTTPELTPKKNKPTNLKYKNVLKKECHDSENLEGSLDDSKKQNGCSECKKRIEFECCTADRNVGLDMEFLQAFVIFNVKEKVLPPSFGKDKISVESVCKFLSSKVKLLQEHIEKIQATLDKKASQCEKHLTQLAELESERMVLLNKTNNMKSSTTDMKTKYMALQNRLNEKDRLYKEQRTETDKLSSEVKRLKAKCAGLEAKCAAQEETIDNLRIQVDTVKRAEKEYKDSTRALTTSHHTTVSQLESRIRSLQVQTDKQSALIDNLRKQNMLLAADSTVRNLEKDYFNFISQD